MFSLICAWINAWANNREAGELRRNRAHYDVIVMHSKIIHTNPPKTRRPTYVHSSLYQWKWYHSFIDAAPHHSISVLDLLISLINQVQPFSYYRLKQKCCYFDDFFSHWQHENSHIWKLSAVTDENLVKMSIQCVNELPEKVTIRSVYLAEEISRSPFHSINTDHTVCLANGTTAHLYGRTGTWADPINKVS